MLLSTKNAVCCESLTNNNNTRTYYIKLKY